MAATYDNMRNERYTETQAIAVLRRLTTVQTCTVPQARRLLIDVLKARTDVVIFEPAKLLRSASDAEIAGLQKGAYAWLWMMTDAKGYWPPVDLGRVGAVIAGRGDLQVTGSLSTMVTWKVYSLLGRVGARLRRCVCGQLFVKVKRQEFCSQRCQKRIQAARLRRDDSPLK